MMTIAVCFVASMLGCAGLTAWIIRDWRRL